MNEFEQTLHSFDLIINALDKSNLQEQIIIKNNNASIEIPNDLKSLFIDAKKTLVGALNIQNQIDCSQRQVVNTSHIKLFRLLSSNAETVLKAIFNYFKNNSWLTKLPKNFIEASIKVIKDFREKINKIISKINSKLFNNEKIKLVSDFNYNIIINPSQGYIDNKKAEIQAKSSLFEQVLYHAYTY